MEKAGRYRQEKNYRLVRMKVPDDANRKEKRDKHEEKSRTIK